MLSRLGNIAFISESTYENSESITLKYFQIVFLFSEIFMEGSNPISSNLLERYSISSLDWQQSHFPGTVRIIEGLLVKTRVKILDFAQCRIRDKYFNGYLE